MRNNKTAFMLISSAIALQISSAAAQNNPMDTPEIRQAMQQTDAAMLRSVEEMNKTMEKVVPQLTDTMNKSLNDVLGSFPQLISAMENNKVLSKTSEQMIKELQNSLQQLNLTTDSYNIQNFNNKVSISGSQTHKDVDLDFLITQDPLAIALTREYIANSTSPNNVLYKTQKITTLNNREIPLENFKIENINGNIFLCLDEKDYTFAIGNLGYNANVRILTAGSNRKEKARDFIKSINPAQIK